MCIYTYIYIYVFKQIWHGGYGVAKQGGGGVIAGYGSFARNAGLSEVVPPGFAEPAGPLGQRVIYLYICIYIYTLFTAGGLVSQNLFPPMVLSHPLGLWAGALHICMHICINGERLVHIHIYIYVLLVVFWNIYFWRVGVELGGGRLTSIPCATFCAGSPCEMDSVYLLQWLGELDHSSWACASRFVLPFLPHSTRHLFLTAASTILSGWKLYTTFALPWLHEHGNNDCTKYRIIYIYIYIDIYIYI